MGSLGSEAVNQPAHGGNKYDAGGQVLTTNEGVKSDAYRCWSGERL